MNNKVCVITTASKNQPPEQPKKKVISVNLNTLKAWNPVDKNAPPFDEEGYEVAKSVVLQVS